jgi:hypothetical protein
LKFSLFVSSALCTWPNEPIKKAVDINTTRGISLGSAKKAAINGAEAANASVSNAPRPTFIQKVEDNVSSVTSFFCTIADVNPKFEKMATKLENTATIAIMPKSLGVSNLAKIAVIIIVISSWAICEVADQPMPRTVLVLRFISILSRRLLCARFS